MFTKAVFSNGDLQIPISGGGTILNAQPAISDTVSRG